MVTPPLAGIEFIIRYQDTAIYLNEEEMRTLVEVGEALLNHDLVDLMGGT